MHINKVEAYTSGDGLIGIRYHAAGLSLIIGQRSNNVTEWTFTEDEPLIGIYGNYSRSKINKLGFLTLSIPCQEGLEDIDDGGNTTEDDGNATVDEGDATVDEGDATVDDGNVT